jgi:hypothetical protein
VLTACHADPQTVASPAAVTPAHVSVSAGDDQQADPGDSLPVTVQFLVTDENHRPMAQVPITLSVPLGGGSVPVATLVTDSAGHVASPWTMGPSSGVQTLDAHVSPLVYGSATATTCDPQACFPVERLSSTLSSATLVPLATYENSGQAVHPDVVRGHGSATGFWLTVTPYPNGNIGYENPSIFRSGNAATWTVPKGLTNPVVTPDFNGYLSDPDMIYNTDGRLWLFFRSVIYNQNVVELTRSRDGVHWDSAQTLISVPSHSLVSPSVVRGAPQGPWQMWSVNSGVAGCQSTATFIEHRSSDDGIHWNQPTPVNLVQPGESIWHIDVQWVPARAEYWALYNAYTTGFSCATDALYLARSADGANWITYPSPIARAGLIPEFATIIYRSTFMIDPKATQVTLWMSGASLDETVGYDWRTATVSIALPDLLAIAGTTPTSLMTASSRHKLPFPEPDVAPVH